MNTTVKRQTSLTAGALLLTGSLVGWTASGLGVGKTTAAAPPAPVEAAKVTPPPAATSYASVVDHVAPAVVTVRSEQRIRNVRQDMPDDPRLREFFEQFGFGQRGPRRLPERRAQGLGSGVIVRPDGYILTNHHVVAGADQVDVELVDGRNFKAKVVGTDEPTDLAVLKIDGNNLQTLALGDSDAVRVGDVVLAVGNPLSVGQTVTMGIVSAKGRATGAGDSFEDFIQTDAPINQGNSGGALVSTSGDLIGINSQILTPSGGNIGIGFAIPANMAKNVMTQLIDSGEVRRGLLGVNIQPITPDLARSLGLSQARGALVSNVNSGSPAEKAGLKRGDVVTAVNGEAIKDSNELRNEVAQLQPGSTVKLTVNRNGAEQTIAVTLAERKLAAEDRGERGESRPDASGFGMAVEPLTGDRARELGVRASTGVVVMDVEAGGKAAEAGLRPGDVIAEVDRKPVSSVEELRSALREGSRPALVLVHRGGTTAFLTMERG